MSHPQPPALILGDDPINGLGVARNLGRYGVAVHRLGRTDNPVLHSRYIGTNCVVPDIDSCDDVRYVEIVRARARDLGGTPVLLPITDLHVLRVHRCRDALRESCIVPAGSRESAEILVNKSRFYRALEQLGIPHPQTLFPRSRSEFIDAAAQVGYPVLVKPDVSPLFAARFGKKGFVARNRSELERHVAAVASTELTVMIQEIIPGDAPCMCGCAGYRWEQGVASMCYRRVREFPPQLGCASLMHSVESFVEQTRLLEFLESIRYRGIFDAEFKLDPRDGTYKLIEINARSWWQNGLPTKAGLNLIKLAYDHAATGQPPTPSSGQPYRTGVKWVYLYHDFFGARERGIGTLRWLRSLRGPRTLAILALDDLRPFLRFAWPLLRGKLSKLRSQPG